MPADDVSRLFTFMPNTQIESGQVNQELNLHVNTLNKKAGREVDNLFTGNNQFNGMTTFQGGSTFTGATSLSNVSLLKTDVISEKTAGAGVTIDSVLAKDGFVRIGSAGYTPTTNGDFGFDSTTQKYKGYIGQVVTFQTSLDSLFPKGYLSGKTPTWNSLTSITVPAGLKAKSSNDTANIEVASSFNISLTTSGAGGLDSGSEASNTWYYVYLIKKSSDGTVSGVFSTVNEVASGSITLPSGYDLKRQLPLAVRNDNSSNLIPYFAVGSIYRPYIGYDVEMSITIGSTSGPCNIYQGTVGTSYTSPVSGSAFIPTGISKVGRFRAGYNPPAAGGYLSMRPAGSHEGERAGYTTGSLSTIYADFLISGTATVELKSTGGNASVAVDVVGYHVTEMS